MSKPRLSMKLLWRLYGEAKSEPLYAKDFLDFVEKKMKSYKSPKVPAPHTQDENI